MQRNRFVQLSILQRVVLLAVVVLSIRSAEATDDPFQVHARLMGRAIVARDAQKVEALLRTPYILLNRVLAQNERPGECPSQCDTHLVTALNYGSPEIIELLLKAGARLIVCEDDTRQFPMLQCAFDHLKSAVDKYPTRTRPSDVVFSRWQLLKAYGIVTAESIKATDPQGRDLLDWLCVPPVPRSVRRIEQLRVARQDMDPVVADIVTIGGLDPNRSNACRQ